MDVLIVANETAAGAHLRREVFRLIEQGASHFTLLVPASKPRRTLTWTEGQARALAEERMSYVLKAFEDMGIEIDGVVGAERPMDAVLDILRTRHFDEIVVSTLPHGISRWLHMDLPARIARASGLPVHHIIGVGERERISA
jgi:nucleotide-binding universal stress UspA family protein